MWKRSRLEVLLPHDLGLVFARFLVYWVLTVAKAYGKPGWTSITPDVRTFSGVSFPRHLNVQYVSWGGWGELNMYSVQTGLHEFGIEEPFKSLFGTSEVRWDIMYVDFSFLFKKQPPQNIRQCQDMHCLANYSIQFNGNGWDPCLTQVLASPPQMAPWGPCGRIGRSFLLLHSFHCSASISSTFNPPGTDRVKCTSVLSSWSSTRDALNHLTIAARPMYSSAVAMFKPMQAREPVENGTRHCSCLGMSCANHRSGLNLNGS